MKKILVAAMAVMLSSPGIACAKDAQLVVFASGAAKDPDRVVAISRASDTAKDKVAGDCTGTVTAIERTGIQCYGGAAGGSWTCVVSARCACRVELRKKHRGR